MILTPLNKQGGNQENGYKTQAATNYFARQGVLKPLTGANAVKLPIPPKRVVTPISEPVKEPTFGEKVKTKASQFLFGTPAKLTTLEPGRKDIKINQPQELDVDALLKASESQLQKVTAREQQIKEEVKQIIIKNQVKSKKSLLGELLPGYGQVSPELVETLTNQIMYMGAGQANTLLKQLNKEDRKRVETLIYENSNNQKAKQLYTQLSSGKYKNERGFADGIKEGFVEAGMDVPSGKEIANLVDSASGFNEVQILWEAAQKQKRGEALTDLEKSYVNKQTSKAMMDALSEKSFGYIVGYSLAQMPKFGLEMYLTSGLSSVPSAFLKATPVFKAIATKAPLLEKITRGLISAVPQTLGFTPQAIDKAQQMTLGEPELILVDGEPMLNYLEQKEGKKFSEVVLDRLPKQMVIQYTEVAGERFGEVLDYAGEAILKKILFKKGVDLAGDVKPGTWQRVLDKMGLNSLLSEYAEEVLQGTSQELIDTGKFTIPWSTPEDRLQQLATLLTVGIYGSVMRVPNMGSRARTKAVQDMMDKLDVDVDLTQEEKEAIGTTEEKTFEEIAVEEETAPTRITEEQTKASTPAEEKLITRIQTQLEAGNDTFVANLREEVAENPKLTKDLESAIAKAEARIAAIEQKQEIPEEKAQKVEKQEVLYRGGAESSIPKNVTAQEVIDYEQTELGNKDVVVEPGINLSEVKSNNLLWLTTTKEAARKYGKVSAVRLGNYRIIARDSEGGVLVEKLPIKSKIQPKVSEKKNVTSPKAVERTKQKPVVQETVKKQEQKPKYTEVQVLSAEAAKQTREMFTSDELKNIANIKRLMNLRRFAEGDIETLRKARPTEVSDLVEAVRRIENNPDLDDDAALIIALGIPNAAQTKPSYYAANKDALYMAINVREDSGERHVTNEEALAIIRKYFTAKELPVEFVDNIRTRDGGEAWGRYARDLVSFVNGTTETAPTHEAVHAYLDLFTTPFQKEAYIARTLSDARKKMKRSELNRQIRETQLQAGQGISVVAASRIWAEEKMANDFIDYVKGNNQKSVLRRFFDRVIRFTRSVIDRNNVENLYQDIINKRRDVIRDVLKPQQDYFQEKLDRFKITTKTLSAMKRELARDVVSRQAIESYTKRQGVTKPDMELIQETLKEFTGDKINVAEFINTIQAKIMPVALIRSSTYADYGTGHLVSLYPKTENVTPADNRFGDNNIMETHIWDTPFRHGQAGHFGADYGDKKLSYEIREVTEPDSGNKVYVVVESGVVLNQENINEAVASTSETREDAEQWIKDHSRDLEVKKSGLLGHSRIASTKTRETITKAYENRINKLEAEIAENTERLKDRNALIALFDKNKKEITNRLNEQVDKMLKAISKRDGDDFKKTKEVFKGFSINYIFDRYNDYSNREKDWGEGVGIYPETKLKAKFMEEILAGYDIPKTDSSGTLVNIFQHIEYLYNPEKKLTQKTLIQSVKSRVSPQYALESLVDSQSKLRDLKNDFHLALQNFQDKPAIRHLLEVQSDPFQSHYALETAYTKARDEVKSEERILATNKETLETFTKQSSENYPPGEQERLKKIEELKNTVIASEADLNLAKKELEKADAARTSLEKQFMAVGAKYHERAIKEEIRLAAHDLLSDQVTEAKFRVPTPLTIAFIEGYTSTYDWEVQNGSLVKKGTNPQDVLKAQMKQEMPLPPVNPNDVLADDQILIPYTDELKDKITNTEQYISVDGELYVVDEISEDDNALVIRRESEDYVINAFGGDTDEKSVGDSITYFGSNYIVLAAENNNLTIAQSDRVRDYDLDEMISESVNSQMDEVSYEIKNFEPKYGKIDTAAQAQKVLDEEGEDNFDNYETRMVLEDMAEADPDKTDLDPYDFMERARESSYESESEYMGEISYWEDSGYKNVAFYDNGNSTRVIYAEEDAEVIDVESPDSEYVIVPDYEMDEETFNELRTDAAKRIIPSDEDYQKAVAEWEKEVKRIKEKYAKLEEEAKNKSVEPLVNREGEYLFDPEKTFGNYQEYLTVYKYYEREVLPFFRKFRKDARLITDENGYQWWETTITKNDQEAVEVYMRKSSFDSLNEIADKLIKSQKIVTKTAKASKKPIDIEGLKKKSKAYSRIVDQMDDLFRQEVSYDQMTIARDAANALEFVTQHPDRALRIAKGLELPPQDITETAISIATADQARESGDYGQWSELERLRSLRQTRRGQEIVSERGRMNENSPEYFLDKVLQERKAIVMSRKGWVYEKKTGKKGVTISEGIQQEVETAKAKVNNRIMNNLESAQDILNRLTCKY